MRLKIPILIASTLHYLCILTFIHSEASIIKLAIRIHIPTMVALIESSLSNWIFPIINHLQGISKEGYTVLMPIRMLQSKRRWKIIENSYYSKHNKQEYVNYSKKESRRQRTWKGKSNIMRVSRSRRRKKQWRKMSIAILWCELQGERWIILEIVGRIKWNQLWIIILMTVEINWPRNSIKKIIWKEQCMILPRSSKEVDIITKVL